jgi:hypothetical protein
MWDAVDTFAERVLSVLRALRFSWRQEMCAESVLGKPVWKVHGTSKVGEGNEVIKLSRIIRKLSCEVAGDDSGVCAVSVCCCVDSSAYMTTVTEMFAYRELCLNVAVGCPHMDRSLNWLGAGLEGGKTVGMFVASRLLSIIRQRHTDLSLLHLSPIYL